RLAPPPTATSTSPSRAPAQHPSRKRVLALTLAIIASFLLDLRFGFATNSSRRVVANHWTTARRLVRFIREHVDLDGDGFSAVLGGPDCNDFDSKINPLAVEIRGSGVDENCDDISAPAAPLLTYAAPPSDSARLTRPGGRPASSAWRTPLNILYPRA